MDVTVSAHGLLTAPADMLVIAALAGWTAHTIDGLTGEARAQLSAELRHHEFAAKEGQTVIWQTHGALAARYVAVIGVGTGVSMAAWYKVADAIVARARDLKARRVAIALPADDAAAHYAALAEGIQLAAYTFDRFKGRPQRRAARLQQAAFVRRGNTPSASALQRAGVIAGATCYARDLINTPAAIVTPSYLAAEARRIAGAQRLRVRILEPRAIARAGMGGLFGVAQGSAQPARFIELVYAPRRARRRVALVGKGVTFDSGGLSLKPADAMQSQKRDMGGGAAVLAVMSVVRDLGIGIEVRGYVPAAENMPGGRALKPGDVLRAYNGTTIEVLNTDAEGRLLLADALAYAAAAKPDVLIDLATLTAAVRGAFGTRYAAVMGTDAAVVQGLIDAGRACNENLWELPLVPEYRSDIDSSIADIKNTGEGSAGTIVAGLFLREFVGTVPWAHIDFSSTVMADKPFPCHPRGATGFGVRTLLQYLEQASAADRTGAPQRRA